LLASPGRWPEIAVGVRQWARLEPHECLASRKHRALFSSRPSGTRPGPKGPSDEIIGRILEFEHRNPSFGRPRSAPIAATASGVAVNEDVVRRVLAKYLRPGSGSSGPSWLIVIVHSKDSSWSVDLRRALAIDISAQLFRHDPLPRYHRCEAHRRRLDIEAIESERCTPTSHPFVERAIGTVGSKLLDETLSCNALDLERKLT